MTTTKKTTTRKPAAKKPAAKKTTTKKSTTAAKRTAPKAVTKPAPEVDFEAVQPEVLAAAEDVAIAEAASVEDAAEVGTETAAVTKLGKKDLIDRVVARAGVKPRYVRQIVDGLLQELGDMLDDAETLQLQPLGTVKVQRRKDVDNGEIVVAKIKRKKADAEVTDPLAAAAE